MLGRGPTDRASADSVVAIAETRHDSDFIALPALKALTAEHGFRFADKHGFGWQYVARFRPAAP